MSPEGAGQKAVEWEEKLGEMGLDTEELQAVWHASSWMLMSRAKNSTPDEIKLKMIRALTLMPT